MNTYKCEVHSKKPEAIVTFEALFFPFDKYIWYCTISFSVAVFILLIFIQKCWIQASEEKPPSGWVFQGTFTGDEIISDVKGSEKN